MSAVIPVAPSAALNPGKADRASLKTLSISTAVRQDSPSSVSSPASPPSPSNVSTPTSSCSIVPPIAIRPNSTTKSTAMTGMAAAAAAAAAALSPAPGPPPKTLSMTTKEWVIPPRPKPGRKPATDTPPTKRKAQNRAAQRAFRERRAARVGELEEQLEEEKIAHEQAIRELQERVSCLEIERQALQSRCQWLESMLEQEQQGGGRMTGSWERPDQQGSTRTGSLMPTQIQGQSGPAGLSQTVRPLQPAPRRDATAPLMAITEPRPLAQPFSISQIVSPAEEATAVDLSCGNCQTNGSCACAEDVLQTADISIGCGKCSLGTRCQCLEETLGVSVAALDLKRPLPPSSPPSTSPDEKRQRSDTGIEMETDFTAMFAPQINRVPTQSIFLPPPEQSQQQPLESVEPKDGCGFCKEGTYCVCADSMVTSTALAAPASQQMAEQMQTRTPPPSEDDVAPAPLEVTATGAIKLPGLRSVQRSRAAKAPPKAGGCGPNGPGTCAQCLADPKSGLFCRSLAANFNKNSQTGSGGCCGNGGPGGCCKAGQPQSRADTLPPVTASARPTVAATGPSTGPNTSFGLSLSCADAYKTLSSHRHFDEAADDIGSWLPKLKALPVPRPGPAGGRGRDGRAPIEVEAASIMSVLKDFDVRFGRGE